MDGHGGKSSRKVGATACHRGTCIARVRRIEGAILGATEQVVCDERGLATKRRRRRTRSPHPGVYLQSRKLPGGGVAIRARFDDPDSGRTVYQTLDLTALSTKEARRAWAIRKAQTLAQRRMDLAAGAPKRSETPFGDAVAAFYESCGHRLRQSTVTNYRHGIDRFRGWAVRQGIAHTEELTPARLAAFREALIAEGRCVVVRGARRGARERSAFRRSPVTVNTYLAGTKVLLNYWRALGLAPSLTRDAITDSLKRLAEPRVQPEYLSPTQLRGLLEAALRHDADVFTETREEHAGMRARGATPRYEPIAPFVAFVLLTGCRRGEALTMRWADVELDAIDHEGRIVGEIRLRADATKTKHARTIGLEVSPALRRLLAALKLRAGRDPFVFGGQDPYTVDLIDAARMRLVRDYGAPAFTWQVLRSTCATYLTNAPSVWGNATVFLSARQLGHSVAVAERHYLGVHRGIPREARTLEAAMAIEDAMIAVVAMCSSRSPKAAPAASFAVADPAQPWHAL